MSITANRSKPAYRTLSPDPSGLRHILIGQGDGGRAIGRLHAAFGAQAGAVEIYYDSQSWIGANRTTELRALPCAQSRFHDHGNALEADLRECFQQAQMGLRLYIAGTERFIWAISNLAFEFGIREDEMQQQQADSLARQVACVHCNATTYPVRTNIVACSACGCQLLVRDHFSRRLNAYMGLQIDAEAPGEIPTIEEVFVP